MLTQTEPENPRTFHRPRRRRPARIQPQRNRQTGENHSERQTGFTQQHRATAHQYFGQSHVDHAECQRTERSGKFQMLHQRELQTEADDRRAEQHGAVDVVALARRPVQQRLAIALCRRIRHVAQLAPGKQQADGEVHQEEQNQERLGAPQQLWRI
jgi:hypothetical protein